jgi:phage terminase small subunit
MSNLTDKQQAFINEYLKCFNATKAAIEAGYSEKSARSIGAENLTKPDIADEIAVRIADAKMSADETLLSLAEIARGDMSDFFTVYGKVPVLDFEKAQKNGKLGLIKKLSLKEGEISFELYDKQSALNTFAKHHGLVSERIRIDISLMVEFVDTMKAIGEDPSEVLRRLTEAGLKKKQDAN